MAEEQFKFELQNLSCASCAAKIEAGMRALPEVDSADLDFAAGHLYLQINSQADSEETISDIRRLITSIESEVRLVPVKTDQKSADFGDAEQTAAGWLVAFPIKLLIRFLLGAVVFALALLPLFPNNIKTAGFITAWMILGYDVILKAVRKIFTGRVFDENFLMTIATAGAIAIGEYPEAAAVMLFYQLGELFQDIAVNRSRASIKALTRLRPDYANKLESLSSEQTIRVMPEQIIPGDLILVKPGERVPLDGIVIAGSSELDTSALTGESMPRPVGEEDELMAGSINGAGLLKVRVSRTYQDSALARITGLVERASSRKSPAEQFISKFAAWYTPVMVGTALVIAILVPLLLSQPFEQWIYRALILLVISCPCALVLSVPLSYFAGIGAASAQGVLVKGGQYLERLSNLTTVVFDKTGTLTRGDFTIVEIKTLAEYDQTEILQLAAALENHSSHPIAQSITKAWQQYSADNAVSGYKPPELSGYLDKPGYGVEANLNGIRYLLGNERMIRQAGLVIPEKLQPEGSMAVWLAAGELVIGCIIIADQLKEGSEIMLRRLKEQGVKRTALLTGDNPGAAARIGRSLLLDDVRAGLLPADKVSELESIMQEEASLRKSSVTAYVGDGINDAPVLARADLGIAIGAASDAAVESADIVLMGQDPRRLNIALDIAGRTSRIVRQNVALTLGLKLIVMLLALAGLGGIWQAVFADVGVSLLAVLNSLRIFRKL